MAALVRQVGVGEVWRLLEDLREDGEPAEPGRRRLRPPGSPASSRPAPSPASLLGDLEERAVAAAIRRLRGSWSQREVAEAAGVDLATWSLYEGARRKPRGANLARVARGLGCTRWELELEIIRARGRLLEIVELEGREEEPLPLRRKLRPLLRTAASHLEDSVIELLRRLGTPVEPGASPPAPTPGRAAPSYEAQALAQAIRALRGQRSQAEVAEAAGVDRTTWSQYEAARRTPRGTNRARVAAGLGCTLLELEKAALSAREQLLLQRRPEGQLDPLRVKLRAFLQETVTYLEESLAAALR